LKYKTEFLHCGQPLKARLTTELEEIFSIIRSIQWAPDFSYTRSDKTALHQTAYNQAFADSFRELGWEMQPKLKDTPRLIGDFRKEPVFGEVQFGNSSTLYRDFYKFQYGLQNGLLSLAVLIVPTNPAQFFPNRPRSVHNMAEYDLALRYFTILPISVPTLIIGLKPN
jgi:hypothetical protein